MTACLRTGTKEGSADVTAGGSSVAGGEDMPSGLGSLRPIGVSSMMAPWWEGEVSAAEFFTGRVDDHTIEVEAKLRIWTLAPTRRVVCSLIIDGQRVDHREVMGGLRDAVRLRGVIDDEGRDRKQVVATIQRPVFGNHWKVLAFVDGGVVSLSRD